MAKAGRPKVDQKEAVVESYYTHLRSHATYESWDKGCGRITCPDEDWKTHPMEFRILQQSGRVELHEEPNGGRMIVLGRWSLNTHWLDEEVSVEAQIYQLMQRYKPEIHRTIQVAFEMFRGTRASNYMMDKTLLSILIRFSSFDSAAVEEGLRIFIMKRNKKQQTEAYCIGIIRRVHMEKHAEDFMTKERLMPEGVIEPIVQKRMERIERVRDEFVRRGGNQLPDREARELLRDIEREIPQTRTAGR